MNVPPRPATEARQRTILTPEGLALRFTLASRGARLGALLLDLLLIWLAIVLVTLALIAMAGGIAQAGARVAAKGPVGEAYQLLFILWLAALFLARNAWFLAFELGPRGATPGKRLLGIRIAARDGGRLTAEMVIARNLLRDVEIFAPFALVGTLGGGWAGWIGAMGWALIFAGLPLFNRDRLRAGDLVGGTFVVEAPRRKLEAALSAISRAPPAPEDRERPAADAPADPAYRFGEAELAAYGEYELQVLERVLREGRDAAMGTVAATICGRIGWSPPGEREVRPFLEAYYTQLRARLETGMRLGHRKADKFTA